MPQALSPEGAPQRKGCMKECCGRTLTLLPQGSGTHAADGALLMGLG